MGNVGAIDNNFLLRQSQNPYLAGQSAQMGQVGGVNPFGGQGVQPVSEPQTKEVTGKPAATSFAKEATMGGYGEVAKPLYNDNYAGITNFDGERNQNGARLRQLGIA